MTINLLSSIFRLGQYRRLSIYSLLSISFYLPLSTYFRSTSVCLCVRVYSLVISDLIKKMHFITLFTVYLNCKTNISLKDKGLHNINRQSTASDEYLYSSQKKMKLPFKLETKNNSIAISETNHWGYFLSGWAYTDSNVMTISLYRTVKSSAFISYTWRLNKGWFVKLVHGLHGLCLVMGSVDIIHCIEKGFWLINYLFGIIGM